MKNTGLIGVGVTDVKIWKLIFLELPFLLLLATVYIGAKIIEYLYPLAQFDKKQNDRARILFFGICSRSSVRAKSSMDDTVLD